MSVLRMVLLLLLLHYLMLLLLLMMANLLFVGNPDWIRLLSQIGSSVNHVGVPITCHPVGKNLGGLLVSSLYK